MTGEAPLFEGWFRDKLEDLILWRRDVRRFRTDPVNPAVIDRLMRLSALAPSVGNSQPWRFVLVESPELRIAIRRNFIACNSEALHDYDGERAKLYASLKLAGLDQAPVHLAVFCDHSTSAGHGLGQRTMPETLDYSVVAAVQTLWLAARSHGLGVGWVSILNPDTVRHDLETPDEWRLIAYLCIGWPQEDHADPELIRHGWQDREDFANMIFRK